MENKNINLSIISNKLYDIISNNDINKNDGELKNMIDTYYQNKQELKNIESEKNIEYVNYIENPRYLQQQLYDTYVKERSIIYNEWIETKSQESLYKLCNIKPFEYKKFPDIYTSKYFINTNLGKRKKELNKKANIIQPEVQPENIELNPIPDNNIDDINKCTKKKEEECKKDGKICNEKTGRCIKDKKKSVLDNIPQKNKETKIDNEVEEIKENKEDNKCTKKKEEECKKDGKICNEKTGRCIKDKTKK
tara:strand:+ start:1504 stop:2253 length:750 start_codon:yes stop_codon:yes gene_type:complete